MRLLKPQTQGPRAGMAAAKARGQHLGRERKLTEKDVLWAKRVISEGRLSPDELLIALRVSSMTLRQALRQADLTAEAWGYGQER